MPISKCHVKNYHVYFMNERMREQQMLVTNEQMNKLASEQMDE